MIVLPDFQTLQSNLSSCSSTDVENALRTEHRSLDDLCALLSPAADPFLPQLAGLSKKITLQRFGRTTQLYGPIYLSNYCTNSCAYCGFSANNRIFRRCLTQDEAAAEAEILHHRGYNHILLVSGEANNAVDVDYLETLAIRLRDKFSSISIEVQPLTCSEYKRLFTAGITAVAVYQETYDRSLYERVHLSGKKCNFDYRLDTPTRIGTAGMREIGIGALLGLGDWRAEGMALGYHLSWLQKRFWQTSFTISFPRLRPAAGEFEPLVQVSERDLSHLIFALRIFDPDIGLLLSTREEARFRDGMLGLGPTRYSAGSCTAPGGYSNPNQPGEQFSVGDHRTLAEVCATIRAHGLDPVYKDWDPVFQQAKTQDFYDKERL
jgi:2-iminoacetate synthase